jgi:hypothetical protein
MTCRRVEQLLFDHLEGILLERDSTAVAAHLTRCPACRRRRELFLGLRGELRGLSALQPPPNLARRALNRWALEQAVLPHGKDGGARRYGAGGFRRCRMAGLSLAAVLIALAAVGLTWDRWEQRRAHHIPGQLAHREAPVPREVPLTHHTPAAGIRHDTIAQVSAGFSSRLSVSSLAKLADSESRVRPISGPSFPSIGRGGRWVRARQAVDDLRYLNGPDPVKNVRPWAPVSRDEWDEIEAKVRRNVKVQDDFVQIPFPRVAGMAEGAIVAAVEQYKHEAAIVDPRLFHEVTLAQKATALSDLCDHLRSDTGIRISAGSSVADEKVTIFCERLPLREAMRQLSRPFGYTWLRSGKQGEFEYELIQDLRSQLEEEALRNHDRDEALLALERGIDRYRPYLNLSPDEALAHAKTAPPGEQELLQKLAGEGWGPIHLYFRLSAQEQTALRTGQKLKFSQQPEAGEMPLPPDLARAVLESERRCRLARREGTLRRAGSSDVDGMSLTAVPEARAIVSLELHQSELGRFNLEGGSGFRISGGKMTSLYGYGPYAVGISPTVREPNNASANASLEHDPSLRMKVTVGEGLSALSFRTPREAGRSLPAAGGAYAPKEGEPAARKVTSADILEALHRATGMPIVSDFYTRLYPAEATSAKGERLFDVLNRLADALRLRWHKEGSWLQFRSASYYDDRLKEVPNRLLVRWAASRRERSALSLDDLIEIAQLSDQQLDAASMAEGAREIWGLEEWDLARGSIPRRHLRFLGQCTPAQRQLAASPGGLAFTRMSLAQQQQFISLAFAYSPRPPDVRLEDLTAANLHVRYALPGGFEWRAAAGPERPADELSVVWAPTREAALQAARRLDPQVQPEQIVPSERALTFLYTHGDSESGRQAVAVRATLGDVTIW